MRAFFATILLATTLPTAAADLAADDSAAGHEQTSGTDAVAATVSAASPGEAEESVGALAAYATAVKLHLERNPVLAAAYISFWNGLTEAKPAAGDTAEVPEERLQGVASTTTRVVRALEERYRQNAAPYRLADTLTIALQAMADGDASSRPESLLATLDRVIAPRVLVNGRYEYAGDLGDRADLGFGPEVWLKCRHTAACVATHDALFARAMGGVSLNAGLDERLENDRQLTDAPEFPGLTAAIGQLQSRADGPSGGLRQIALAAANDYWQAIGTRLAADAGEADNRSAAADPGELAVLLTLGRTSAYLAGSEKLAGSFGVIGSPAMDFARLAAQGALGSTFVAATAGVGLLFAGVQAVALFDGGASGSETAPSELRALVTELHESTWRNVAGLRAENILANNAMDTRLAALGVTLDVIRDDVERIESSQRTRLRASFQAQDTRRWTDFDEDNDRCFSLRNIDPRTEVLRTAEFRRCEERFLQGAVRRSRYATRSTDFILDARYLEPADLRFPFHHQYPLLLGMGGMETKTALALADPFEWQQHAAALLRLYQDNPAARGDYAKRAEVLRGLRAAGAGIHEALTGLVVDDRGNGQPAFRIAVHEQALDDYFGSLEALTRRVVALDDPDADRYGKRLTVDLLQAPPTGRKRDAIETVLSGATGGSSGLRTCATAGDEDFLAPESGLLAESRRFFDAPITASELARSWNRSAADDFDLAPEDYATLVPARFLWAALDGLGKLDVCLTRFRPAIAAFTREEAAVRDHLQANTTIEARIEVRFAPGPALAQAAGFATDAPAVVVTAYAAERACTFAYRNDNEGCSRGRCLATLAPTAWSGAATADAARCEGPPLREALAKQDPAGDPAAYRAMEAAIESLYWHGRAERTARLEADVLRSSEYETASARYLQYFALAGITLGTYPDVDESLAPLFSTTGELAPRAIVRALVVERTDLPALLGELGARREEVKKLVTARGGEVASAGALRRLPHLRGLEDTLNRVDLMLAAYQR